MEATAGLAGYWVGFTADSDHELGQLQVSLDTTIIDNVVNVQVTYGLRDWSGEFDDLYEGWIEFIVLADLEPAVTGPTREDLIVTGLEFNQATQFFRSVRHLDSANVEEGNSIPLVSGKTTAIRVYSDYDDGSGLPPIDSLDGQLEVTTSANSFDLSPITTIAPRRDSAIDRAAIGDTLNFILDAEHCHGEVTVRCSVFDEADPTQVSARFTDTLRFIDVETLKLHMVGVHYTGQGLNLPAPTIADFIPILWMAESTFPTAGVQITGYTKLNDFDADIRSDVPCADGFDKLRDLIRDLRGDSDEVYCGVLPASASINFGRYPGCGGSKYRIAMGPAKSAWLWAHEIGHAFGRRHAPCDSPPNCDDPAGEDPQYPQYGRYASDSIGEFGFGPDSGSSSNYVVRNPRTTHDIMGYTPSSQWISPYTYMGLMQHMIRTLEASTDDAMWNRVTVEALFLDLTIDRRRHVERRPSFHFPTRTLDIPGRATPFEVEILDDCRRTLACHTLTEDDATCGRSCWPKRFYEKIAFPDGAKWLVVWEGRDVLYEECLPAAPRIDLTCDPEVNQTGVHLRWHATASAGGSADLWFLVQYEDIDGTWRGLAPRTHDKQAFIPMRLFGRRQQMRVRVLATSGIATGRAECLVSLDRPGPTSIRVVLAGEPTEPDSGPVPVHIPSGIARVFTMDSTGRMLTDGDLVWFDERGREVGRGPSLDIRRLEDVHLIRVVATRYRTRGLPIERAWRLEKAADEIRLRPEEKRTEDEQSGYVGGPAPEKGG